jgi:NADH:ubiquinone oxidoreductase subunit 3 (subunit A)
MSADYTFMEDAIDVFDVRFYLATILFLVFDLEAVYFFS